MKKAEDDDWPFNNRLFLEKFHEVLKEAATCPKCRYNDLGILCRRHFDSIIRAMPGVHDGVNKEGRRVWFGLSLRRPTG